MKLIENRQISKLTTFGIGGPAKLSLDVHTVAEMQEAIVYCNEKGLPFFILGKGSNCLFDDRGLDAVLIVNKINFLEHREPSLFYVGAGYSFSRLGSMTARKGFSGLEFASGIPGSVGGAIFMNAGANGTETKETLISVDFVNDKGDINTYKKEDLHFSYRHSSFQEKKGAIVAATFQLQPSSESKEKQLKIINYRKSTQPYGDKSAGCIFKNPENGHAGALIEKIGLKNMQVGGAKISDMHANFIINSKDATAENVLELIKKIQERVKAETGIKLENEVRFIPYNWGKL